jgi:hypothetical protein
MHGRSTPKLTPLLTARRCTCAALHRSRALPRPPSARIPSTPPLQLQRAILASESDLAGVAPERCQALLASSVGVAFGVRSKASLDSGEALAALQAAFSAIAGGFAPFRIAVRVAEPLEALRDAPPPAAGGGADAGGGGPRGTAAGARRRRGRARRALRASEPGEGNDGGGGLTMFPEKQVGARGSRVCAAHG